uniref:Uncharacterized protein n=1 Tax=Neobodo designis TaxID=312471 RepID=A0A7S1R569_NEODS|mmetsp:Transcript_8041/g.25069  ORF Transcript_8041/g.25069 Transcript_8041/m.25069 type:complete len:106 (+) Transcript_8041:3-320(+)
MMNIFPSVLTVAYRRALATPQYDTEVLSLWLMIKPLLRKAGFVRTKRIGRRRARSITATLEDSFHDVEMDDDEKLAAKARRDGDGDGNDHHDNIPHRSRRQEARR